MNQKVIRISICTAVGLCVLISCSTPKIQERDTLLEGSWFFCEADGYGELHCNEIDCWIDYRLFSINQKFSYEIIGDTLYTSLGDPGNDYIAAYHISTNSKGSLVITRRLKSSEVLETHEFKPIDAQLSPLNINEDPYREFVYKRAYRIRQNKCNCPGDTVKVNKVNLGTINWEAFGIDDTTKVDSLSNLDQ